MNSARVSVTPRNGSNTTTATSPAMLSVKARGGQPSSPGGASRALGGLFGGEGTKGEEGAPEPAFCVIAFQGRGEGGEPEARGPLCPGEPGAFWALRERRPGKRVVQRIYGAGGGGTERHQGAGL